MVKNNGNYFTITIALAFLMGYIIPEMGKQEL